MDGKRLYYLRKQFGMSQRELAERIAVSPFTVSAYENGRSDPNDDIKIRICQVFDVSLDYLVGLIDEPLPYQRKGNVLYLPKGMDPSAQQVLREFLRFLDGGPPENHSFE